MIVHVQYSSVQQLDEHDLEISPGVRFLQNMFSALTVKTHERVKQPPSGTDDRITHGGSLAGQRLLDVMIHRNDRWGGGDWPRVLCGTHQKDGLADCQANGGLFAEPGNGADVPL